MQPGLRRKEAWCEGYLTPPMGGSGDFPFPLDEPTRFETSEAGAGSNVTGENVWRTVSRRSAENANGSVDAYVVGQGAARGDPRNPASWKSVFSGTELPTLLHNPNCNQINFRDPNNPGGKPTTWNRAPPSPECPAGAWSGPSVPSAPSSTPPGSTWPGMTLHSAKGFTRP